MPEAWVDVFDHPGGADVTVIIPTIKGREEPLRRALSTVAYQTMRPQRVIVVHDDNFEGAAFARNLGIKDVQTTYTCWLDDDDLLLENHVDILLKTARDTSADLVYSYAKFVGGRDPLATSVDGRLVHPFGVPFGEEQALHLRNRGNFIPVTYLVRTDLVRKVGGMPEPFSPEWPRDCEDYGLLVKMLDAGGKFVHAPYVTWVYMFHEENTGGYKHF